MKTCIVYYSKMGNTEIAAKYLGEKIGAQLIKLADDTNYKGLVGFIKGGMNANLSKMAQMDNTIYKEIEKYERIILATPVWSGKTTPAINAVLENVDFSGKEVYALTTQADPDVKDAPGRKQFYQDKIEEKNGKFVELYSLHGSSPQGPPKSKEDLSQQVDQLVNI
jgi:flavodoxin